MQLSNAARDREIAEEDAISSAEIIESFLVRRAICGHEPTGLHAVFKRLWLDCRGAPNREHVQSALKRHKTVSWPSNQELASAVKLRPLYGSAIANFVLLEYDRSLGGDVPEIDFWIEHVLPEKPVSEWFRNFSKRQHLGMKDLLANLLPLSKKMNVRLKNGAFAKKRKVYTSDSAFKSAREFAREHTSWNPQALEARSKHLAEWAKARWPY
jgi:hypothetical protein